MRKISCLLIFSLVFFTKFGHIKPKHYKRIESKSSIKHLEINDSNLLNICKLHGLIEPEIVLAQAKLETGNYSSDVFITNNNLFGLYDSNNKEYYKYDTWEESVIAYKNLIQSKLYDDEDYYDFLKRIGYAQDPKYIKKVKSVYNN